MAIMSSAPGVATLRRVILDKKQMAVSLRVPRHIIQHGTIEQHHDHLSGDMLYRWSALVAARTTSKTAVVNTVNVPLTWWDHVKERFAPAWAVKRWPVEYRTIDTVLTATTTNICPHVDARDDGRDHFEWLAYGGCNGD